MAPRPTWLPVDNVITTENIWPMVQHYLLSFVVFYSLLSPLYFSKYFADEIL